MHDWIFIQKLTITASSENPSLLTYPEHHILPLSHSTALIFLTALTNICNMAYIFLLEGLFKGKRNLSFITHHFVRQLYTSSYVPTHSNRTE
jgi:hypothetical protein